MRLMAGLAVGVVLLVTGCGDGDESKDDGVTSIFDSPECRAFCLRLETACPGTRCDPQTDCDEAGDCLAEKRADLACKADPRSTDLTCNSGGGYGTVGLCVKPRNLCR
jgi:hypothetical protein